MKERLSSDNLYHFTKDTKTVSKIINFGFRYSLCHESVPFKSSSRNLFNVSFCDIKFDDSENHRKCYGNYSIVLSKEWGIRNGVSPVRYVHSNSPGLSESSVLLRKNYHLLTGLSMNCSKKHEFSLLYLITSIMKTDKKNEPLDFENEIENNLKSFKTEYGKFAKEFYSFYNTLKLRNEGEELLFKRYIDSLIYRISELHNEMIESDNFTRIYEDRFKCPLQQKEVNKILYDEREWRAIHLEEIDQDESAKEIPIVDSYLNQGFLPQKYNLKFNEHDVIAILVINKNDKEMILESTQTDNCLLTRSFIEKKTYTIDEFQEV